jgi:Ca-activated chloride channel family protein
MVLLTDGADTGSRIPPETAARVAEERKVVIHTVALGQPGNAVDKVDTATLQTIARITHGRFALAGRADELQSVYAQLDALETRNHDTLIHRPQRPLHQWPLGAAVLLPLVWQLVRALVALVQSLRRSLARSSNRSSVPGEVPHA